MKKIEKSETIYQEQKKGKKLTRYTKNKKKGKNEKIYKKKTDYLGTKQKKKKKKTKKGTKKSISARYI